MNDFKYLYLRDAPLTKKDRGFPVALVAFSIDRNTNTITYGLATVHPDDKDAHFDRKLARELAVGRLILERKQVKFPTHKYNSFNDIIWNLMTHLSMDKTLPKRTRKVVDLWIVNAAQHELESGGLMPVVNSRHDDYSKDAFETYPKSMNGHYKSANNMMFIE